MISHDLQEYTFTNNKLVIDLSGWKTISIQVIGGSGTRSILGTNNPGNVTGSTDGGPADATDFNAVQAVNLSSGTAVTAITTSDIYRIDPVAFKYLQIGDGSTATATKIYVFRTTPV